MRNALKSSRFGPPMPEAPSGEALYDRRGRRRQNPSGVKIALGVLSFVALLIAAGPAASSSEFAAAPTKVKVIMTDYKFALSKKSVRKGAVVFQTVNSGEVVHDFKIAGKKTPIFEAGQGGTLRVVFKKIGRYPYICTIPGHVAIGMKGTLKVVP